MIDSSRSGSGQPRGTSRVHLYQDKGYTLISYAIERLNEFGEKCAVSGRYRAHLRPRFTADSLAAQGVTAAFMFTARSTDWMASDGLPENSNAMARAQWAPEETGLSRTAVSASCTATAVRVVNR